MFDSDVDMKKRMVKNGPNYIIKSVMCMSNVLRLYLCEILDGVELLRAIPNSYNAITSF